MQVGDPPLAGKAFPGCSQVRPTLIGEISPPANQRHEHLKRSALLPPPPTHKTKNKKAATKKGKKTSRCPTLRLAGRRCPAPGGPRGHLRPEDGAPGGPRACRQPLQAPRPWGLLWQGLGKRPGLVSSAYIYIYICTYIHVCLGSVFFSRGGGGVCCFFLEGGGPD